MRPSSSQRWGGLHGSSSSNSSSAQQGDFPTASSPRSGTAAGSSRRAGTHPASSPRALSLASGGTAQPGSARDQQRGYSRDTAAGAGAAGAAAVADGREWRQSGSGSGRKAPKAATGMDYKEDKQDTREDSSRIRVAVRVRPFSEKEKLAGTRCVISMASNRTKILDPAYFDSEDVSTGSDDRSMWERTFSFDHSFWSHSPDDHKVGGGGGGSAGAENGSDFSSQADVHQALGEFLLDNACRGFNCSLFAYGQTGSGKTYTMLGDSSDLATAAGEGTAGLIPRICVELFQRFGPVGGGGVVGASRGAGQASIQVSFCEIYNEQVRDLFCQGDSGGHGLRVREHPTRGAFVEGLSARPVTCYQQVQRLLENGMSARATAATAMNEVSSRSHAIFTIYISVTSTTRLSPGGKGDGGGGGGGGGGAGGGKGGPDKPEEDISSRTSKICLVDLAGSERANATGAKGDRLREASNINKSLSTLGDVIKALAKRAEPGRGGSGGVSGSGSSESFIPYRNSMLTWLLKDSIGGNSKTVMLAAISPVADAYHETMSTLRYVERAKEIVNTVAINDVNVNPLVARLREEIRKLKTMVETNESTIAEHEGKEAVLTEALERVRAVDSDKASRALEDASHLEVILQTERRERAAAAATANEEAAAADQRSRQQIDALKKVHTTEMEGLLARGHEDVKTAKREAEDFLAEELARAREHAAEERKKWCSECEDAAEVERLKISEVHREEMAVLAEAHRAETQGIVEGAANAAACATESVAIDMSQLRQRHARELADSTAAGEETRVEALRRLQDVLDQERTAARRDASEAREVRRRADEDREAQFQERTANAAAVADKARTTAVHDLQKQFDVDFVRLSEEHGMAVKAAVEEATERLRVEHESVMTAEIAAAESLLLERHLEEVKVSEERLSVEADAAIAALNVEHAHRMVNVRRENAEAISKAQEDANIQRTADLAKAADSATASVAAEKANSLRHAEALEQSHREQLAAVKKRHGDEVRHAAEVERLSGKAELAETKSKFEAAMEALTAEESAARALLEAQRRGDLSTAQANLEAEIEATVANAKRRENEAREDATQRQKAALAAAKLEADGVIASLGAIHKQNLADVENRCRVEVEAASSEAEQRRQTDMEAFETRTSTCLAAANSSAAETLAALKEDHQGELSRIASENKAEIDKLLASTESRRDAELAAAKDAMSWALDEARAEHEASLNAMKSGHGVELSACLEAHRCEIERVTNDAAENRKSYMADAKKHLISSLAALKEGTTLAAAAQEARNLEEKRKIEEDHVAEIDRVAAGAENRRASDIDEAQQRHARSIAEAQEKCAVASNSRAKLEHEAHQGEIRRIEAENKAEVGRLLASAEGRRDAELAAAADALSRALDEARAEHEASLAAIKSQHSVELSVSLDAHRREIERVTKDASEKREIYMADAKKHLLSSLAAMEAETESAAAAQEARCLEEKGQIEKKHVAEIDGVAAAAESRRVRDMAEAQLQHAKSLAEAEKRAAASMSRTKLEHDAEVASLKRAGTENESRILKASLEKNTAELETLASGFEEGKKTYEAQMSATVSAIEQSHHEALTAVLAQKDEEIAGIRTAAEENLAAERSKMSATAVELIASQTAEIARLGEEHAAELTAVARRAEERRVRDLDDSERRFEATADAVRKELAEEKATFVTRHLLDLRRVKEDGALKLERVSAQATERCAAREAEAATELSRLKASHLEEMQAASFAAEAARKTELDGFSKRLALMELDKAGMEDDMRRLAEQHRCDLQIADEEREAGNSAELTAASERHAEALTSALAEANVTAETIRIASLAAQEEKFAETLRTVRSSHAEALAAAEALCESIKTDAKLKNEALNSEHLLAATASENSHRVAIEELEDRRRVELTEMGKRLEAAELAAVEAQASADEFGTRAAALDEMLRTSVGSKEQELAGHRSRVAQLQAFVARRESSLLSSDKNTDGGGGADGTSERTASLSPAATRSVQQRVIDLRAMAAGVGAGVGAGGVKVGGGETGLEAFASTGLVEGLTLEKYAEELEVVLVRATVEATAARQDHLEADMQHQSVTRQLVGLKLVHAQLRECLEDTQVKLEHKSQSAARRLLNSAARLAFEFAKPDRSSVSTAKYQNKGFSKTTPKAMRRQASSSNRKSPLGRSRDRAFRRSRSPPSERGLTGNDTDLGATL